MTEDCEEKQLAKHEFTYKQEKEFLQQLLEYDEQQSIQSITSNPPAREKIYVSGDRSINKNTVATALLEDSFSSWIPDPTFSLRKSEKTDTSTSSKSQSKDYNKEYWRDWKSKEIRYVFKHYSDIRSYIEQYRYQHTSSLTTPNGRIKSAGARISQLDPAYASRLVQARLLKPVQQQRCRQHNQRVEETSIVDLSHKYKLSPDALKRESFSNTEVPKIGPEIRSPSQNSILKVGRDDSAKQTILCRSSGNVNLTPHGSVVSSKSGSTVMSGAPSLVGKTVRHTPTNALTLEKHTLTPLQIQSVVKATDSTGLRTLDILSSVAAVDKQMWFDASGRAYVSLATRYQPARK